MRSINRQIEIFIPNEWEQKFVIFVEHFNDKRNSNLLASIYTEKEKENTPLPKKKKGKNFSDIQDKIFAYVEVTFFCSKNPSEYVRFGNDKPSERERHTP